MFICRSLSQKTRHKTRQLVNNFFQWKLHTECLKDRNINRWGTCRLHFYKHSFSISNMTCPDSWNFFSNRRNEVQFQLEDITDKPCCSLFRVVCHRAKRPHFFGTSKGVPPGLKSPLITRLFQSPSLFISGSGSWPQLSFSLLPQKT